MLWVSAVLYRDLIKRTPFITGAGAVVKRKGYRFLFLSSGIVQTRLSVARRALCGSRADMPNWIRQGSGVNETSKREAEEEHKERVLRSLLRECLLI